MSILHTCVLNKLQSIFCPFPVLCRCNNAAIIAPCAYNPVAMSVSATPTFTGSPPCNWRNDDIRLDHKQVIIAYFRACYVHQTSYSRYNNVISSPISTRSSWSISTDWTIDYWRIQRFHRWIAKAKWFQFPRDEVLYYNVRLRNKLLMKKQVSVFGHLVLILTTCCTICNPCGCLISIAALYIASRSML